MALGEFDLIERYFHWPQAPWATVGNGDDCAVLAPAAGMQLAVSTDTLVEGRHFLSTVEPQRLGHKCLAVNLSDLAACGARPRGFTLALTLPQAHAGWLQGFAQGLRELALAQGCELLGGDTTSGPLSITITAFGEVPAGGALLRRTARIGDDLWVSGQPGLARLALEAMRDVWQPRLGGDVLARTRMAMEAPQPRVALGLALRGVASAAIDVSDGLLADLGHILRASHVDADVHLDALPMHPCLAALPQSQQRVCLLAGGDDYELLFAAPVEHRQRVLALQQPLGLALTRIGRLRACRQADRPQAQVWQGALDDAANAQVLEVSAHWQGFDHFVAAGGANT